MRQASISSLITLNSSAKLLKQKHDFKLEWNQHEKPTSFEGAPTVTEILLDEPEVRDILLKAAIDPTRHDISVLSELAHKVLVAAHSSTPSERHEEVAYQLRSGMRNKDAVAQQIIDITTGKHLTWFQLESISQVARLPIQQIKNVPLPVTEELYSDAIRLGPEHEAIRSLYDSLEEAYITNDYEAIQLMLAPESLRSVSYVDDGWFRGDGFSATWYSAWSQYGRIKKDLSMSQRFKVDCYEAAFSRLAKELAELDTFDHAPLQKVDHDRWHKRELTSIREVTFYMFCCLAGETIWPRTTLFVEQQKAFLPAVQAYAEAIKNRVSVDALS